MTDITERLNEAMFAIKNKTRVSADLWNPLALAICDATDEIERLREELYEIKLAAAGGEDAPGAANMVRAKDVERWTKELWCRVRDGETEIDRLREALRQIAQCDFQAWARNALDKNLDDQRKTLERIAQYDMQKIAIDALGEEQSNG